MDRSFYNKKLDRLHRMMAKHDLDAVLLAKNDNTRYITGYQRYFCTSYLPFVHAVLVSRDGGPVLLLPEHIMGWGPRCYSEEVRLFPMGIQRQMGVLREVVARRRLAKGRIGVEADFMQVEYYQALQETLPEAQIVSAVPCIEETVAVKIPEEVALLREAARLVDLAVDAMMDAVREGMTEKQLAAVGAVALREGAEFFNHLCVRTGENAYLLAPTNTDRVIRRGDPIQLDIGYIYEGYVSDINRTKILGGPNADQELIIRTGVRMERSCIQALKPGVRACDVYSLAKTIATHAGFGSHFSMPFVGHSIGVSLHENPYMTPFNENTIEEGMVIAMEPGLYVPGQGTCRMEDMVVVTAAGVEFLTHCPDDLELNGLS